MAPTSGFRVRRVYDPPEPADGVRVLVDRLWPRGVSKEHAAVDEWSKELTPSARLRTWYHANPEQYDLFVEPLPGRTGGAGGRVGGPAPARPCRRRARSRCSRR